MLANIKSPVSSEPDIVTKLLPFPILSCCSNAKAPKLPEPIIILEPPYVMPDPALRPINMLLSPSFIAYPALRPIATLYCPVLILYKV